MTGWLVSRFGTKRVMVWSIGIFTLATLLCGMAQSLEMLVLWRILQGGAGAPVVPLSQTILLNTFPRRQHTMVMSDLRHGGRGRAGVRPDVRRLSRRGIAGAGRSTCWCRSASRPRSACN
jgi:MFS family permease